MMNFKLDNETVNKQDFIRQTNNKEVTIEKIGKLFQNRMFQKEQFILRISCEDIGILSKFYITPTIKDREDELLYFSSKSFLNPLVIYALTGELKRTGVTVDLPTVKEALENNTFTITYDFSGKYPMIKGVE